MKVIFLDIDGVLNSENFAIRKMEEDHVDIFCENILDKRCLCLLKTIIDNTGAAIVLSSSWRLNHTLRNAAKEWLEKYEMIIHSDTPCSPGCRGNDIDMWFEHHQHENIESYVILDDDSDMGQHINHLVQTSFYDWGLNEKHVQQAIDIFNRKYGE